MRSVLCEAAVDLGFGEVDDDTTVAAVKLQKCEKTNLLIGPPHDSGCDRRVLADFFSRGGNHIVCGGSTAHMAAEFLGKKLTTLSQTASDDVPAISQLEGTELVTEGYLTLKRAAQLAQSYVNGEICAVNSNDRDGASQLCKMIFERSSDVEIFFGTADNPTSGALGTSSQKLEQIRKLSDILEEMGKRVKINIC
jgi:hypothetical protein